MKAVTELLTIKLFKTAVKENPQLFAAEIEQTKK